MEMLLIRNKTFIKLLFTKWPSRMYLLVYCAHDIGATDLSFSRSENLMRLFLSKSLSKIISFSYVAPIGAPDLAFSKSENFIRHFLSKSRSKILSFPYVAPMI